MVPGIRGFIFAFLIALAVFFSIYVVKIHEVASHVYYLEGGAYWPSTGYSLFPQAYTPEDRPRLGVLPVLVPLTSIEIFILRQFVETSLLVVIALSLWIISGALGISTFRDSRDVVEKRFILTVTLFLVGVSCIATSHFITSNILFTAGLILSLSVALVATLLRKRIFLLKAN